MTSLQSARPRWELTPYVRAYAQRIVGPKEAAWIQIVPAQLEQILNFEFGVLPGIRHRSRDISREILVGGAQGDFSGTLELRPGVESFAVFFWPSGWSELFNIPVRKTTDNFDDATAFHGNAIREIWNRMGEEVTFERRVAILEVFLMSRLPHASRTSKISIAAQYLFKCHGAVKIPNLGRQSALSLRQFERLFRYEMGMPAKAFARIARFQTAMDAKLANPRRTWLDIAHSFGYYDQMHMVHDFEQLGQNTPTQVLIQMGDVRPPALVSAENFKH
jgi:AraC-like DNA-binding protein